MERKAYVKPFATEEGFVANEFVAACYSLVGGEASAYCVLPGNNTTTIDGSTPWYYEGGKNGIPHGSCASGNVITSINGHAATGHEGGDKSSVSLDNLVFGEEATETSSVTSSIGTSASQLEKDKWYKATWTSTYAGNTYHHVGLVHITSGTARRDTSLHS